MITLCLRFPDKVTAHSFLYDDDGNPIYETMFDGLRAGIPTERYLDAEENELFRLPSDGSYHADIKAESVPDELKAFVIPTPQYRRHKFAGE